VEIICCVVDGTPLPIIHTQRGWHISGSVVLLTSTAKNDCYVMYRFWWINTSYWRYNDRVCNIYSEVLRD